jgi:hypothetical protein
MPKNRLLIEVAEDTLRIEFRLELLVGFTVINAIKFVFGVERLRIERLAAAELLDDAFDTAVVMADLPVRRGDTSPESKVQVKGTGFHSIEGPTSGGIKGSYRTDPARPDVDLAKIKFHKFARFLHRDLDILDHLLEPFDRQMQDSTECTSSVQADGAAGDSACRSSANTKTSPDPISRGNLLWSGDLLSGSAGTDSIFSCPCNR